MYRQDRVYTETPFIIPSIARHCKYNYERSFSYWGQQAHVLTSYKSAMLYANRHRDCVDGMLDVTSVIHNDANVNADNSNNVKLYILWSVLLSDPTGEI